MDWLEQNLDAYRIIAEILMGLREVLRDELEAATGKAWYRTALPEGLLERLIEIKEKEKAIDWYESEYQQVMNYAVFPDLLEILEHNAELFPHILRLAPTNPLLHARFLELEVMRSKLGRARPISETELAFLGTFHLRFRKAIDEFRTTRDERRTAPAVKKPPPVQAPDLAPAARPASKPAVAQEAPQPTPSSQRRASPSVAEAKPPPQTPTGGTRGGRRVAASVAPPAMPDQPPAASEGAPQEPVAQERNPIQLLEDALRRKDDRAVLRALYQEVTATAESIWGRDDPPTTMVWNRVSTSPWYEERFSRMGLKPLSDYYEVISKVSQRMRNGSSKQELQQYLKESNFAHVLLALRDMFQRNGI